MNRLHTLTILILAFLATSCGSNNKLEVPGDPEAVVMAGEMLEALGGKKAWSKIQSVYIRTITTSSSSAQPYVFEEWINLDEPKFMNRTTEGQEAVIQIVDHNDGWMVNKNKVTMIPPARITGYLGWHHQHLLVNLRKLANENEKIILKLKEPGRFDLYLDGRITCGFELGKDHKIKKYYSYPQNGHMSILAVNEYRTYKGYVFPLELAVEGAFTSYKTDYFDPSPLEADKAFPISFDPNDFIE